MYRCAIVLSIILCAGLILGAPCSAEDQEFLVSQAATATEQNTPSIAVGLNGKFAVIWTDYRNGQSDIYCQLYDSGVTAVGWNFKINDDANFAWQFDPDLSSDWYGNYYAVFKDYRQSGYPFDPDIYFQKLDSTGPSGNNINVTTEGPDSSHQSPSVAATGWGKAVIAWTDLRNTNWDVFTQSISSQGAPLGASVKVNDDVSTTPQHEPDVALSPDGWSVVVWYDGRNGNDDIYIQKFDSSGTPVGDNIRVNTDTGAARQKFPDATIGGNGEVTIVWTDWRNGTYPANPDIYYQRFDSDLNRLGTNLKISRDFSNLAQRDPRVASDRTGNTCAVWSDSASGEWNVTAQMFDAEGNFVGQNFGVNIDSTGKQLLPDVAIDGFHVYFTWADSRGGDFDIYGRVYQYNDPSFVIKPYQIDFSKDINDTDPAGVYMVLDNAGYGEFDYSAGSIQSWITLSKTSGTTPDSILVGVNSPGLDFGNYQGSIRLVNETHGDSSTLVPITLTITGPLISYVPDSLVFRGLSEIGDPGEQSIQVSNAGSGTMFWEARVSQSWILLDSYSGSGGDIVSVGCDASQVIAGMHTGYIIFEDADALNSPESLLVTFNLESNLPYLVADPDTVYHQIVPGEAIDDSVRVINLGNSASDWTAEFAAPWLTFNPQSGSDNDLIYYGMADIGADPGRYLDSLIVADTNAFNNPLIVPFFIDISLPDTIFSPPVNVEAGLEFQAQLYVYNHAPLVSGDLTIGFDGLLLEVDSVVGPSTGELAGRVVSEVNSEDDSFRIQIPADTVAGEIGEGPHHLADVYATANDSMGATTRFFVNDWADFTQTSSSGYTYRPFWRFDDIEINSPTSVEGQGENLLPAVFSLRQNSPNPFNGRTTIYFSLDRASDVRLELYNILGQRVATVVDAHMAAGEHQAVWDGRNNDGQQTASGVYFYRLTSATGTAVRKMVFLK